MTHLASRSAPLPRVAVRTAAAALFGLSLAFAPVDTAEARGAPDSFAELAEQVSPAVVNITTATMVEVGTGPGPMVRTATS